MPKQVSASNAKNNFGGLLEDVAALGRVDIVRHGRVVAVVVSPRFLDSMSQDQAPQAESSQWGAAHMFPAKVARRARILNQPSLFDEE
jgi:prevent-host-death family protein